MEMPVDLTNLREMIDGDSDMEKALFEEFFLSFEAGMQSLQENCGETAADAWRKEVHALKGISLNLGAQKLGKLCKKAQDDCLAATEEKQKMLAGIQEEYARVRQVLLVIMMA